MMDLEVRLVVAKGAKTLANAGVTTPRVDAELLAAHLLGLPRTALVIAPPMTDRQAERYREIIGQRARRIPLQHLTGTAPFRRLELAVGPGAFVPRPETELLVEWGLAGLAPGACVVDLCSGTGAVALAVADEAGGDEAGGLVGTGEPVAVYAVETDPVALTWLIRNVDQRATDGAAVTVVHGDATDPRVLADLDGTVDLVLCNPPYVPVGTWVEPEVADHDPVVAVFGGADGLDVIRGIIARAGDLLRPGGRLGMEHDESHGDEVLSLLDADGRYDKVTGHDDLAGRQRFVTAVRRA